LRVVLTFSEVMSYDLMNRRDTVTAHHSSISGAAQAVQNYLDIGAPASKINLGFAYYAKYFTTAGDCTSSPLNCPIVVAEDPITGKDTLTSGAWTFEKSHMQPVNGSVPVSNDGTCGAEKGTKCASGCCSQYGNCGTSKEHCSGACQHAFGTGCTDADIAGSWQLAAANGVTDNESGGQYFFDAANKLFWTWDTTQLMARKFQEIVAKNKLGGVMAWSLGEDSYDWSHIQAMAQGAQSLASSNSAPSVDVPAPVLQAPAAPSVSKSTNTKSKKSKKSNKKPKEQVNKPAKAKYNVVYVDGVGGPDAEEAAVTPLPLADEYPVESVAKSKNAAAAAAANDKPVAAHPVVPVSGQPQKASSSKFRKTKYVEPGPDDDWEWRWIDENGKLLEKRAEGSRMKRRMQRV
jgi:chitinase